VIVQLGVFSFTSYDEIRSAGGGGDAMVEAIHGTIKDIPVLFSGLIASLFFHTSGNVESIEVSNNPKNPSPHIALTCRNLFLFSSFLYSLPSNSELTPRPQPRPGQI